jgi:uncharacterized radical SAM superfamily Fe-S cluster-containing enzyme
MIEVSQIDWAGSARDAFDRMMQGDVMEKFLDHLVEKRDGLLVEAAWLSFSNAPMEASQKVIEAQKIGACHEVLVEFAKGSAIPGSVKIITRP